MSYRRRVEGHGRRHLLDDGKSEYICRRLMNVLELLDDLKIARAPHVECWNSVVIFGCVVLDTLLMSKYAGSGESELAGSRGT